MLRPVDQGPVGAAEPPLPRSALQSLGHFFPANLSILGAVDEKIERRFSRTSRTHCHIVVAL